MKGTRSLQKTKEKRVRRKYLPARVKAMLSTTNVNVEKLSAIIHDLPYPYNEIMKLVLEGESNHEIAAAMEMPTNSIQRYIDTGTGMIRGYCLNWELVEEDFR